MDIRYKKQMSISVIIPTYLRLSYLKKCLKGLEKQTSKADEIIIVTRKEDSSTNKFLHRYQKDNHDIKILHAGECGQVAALNKGLSMAQGSIIAFIDDDAVPRPDWIEKIITHFLKDKGLGAIGGKDLVPKRTKIKYKKIVGKVQWFGRVIGNHHLGQGNPREVDFLKGVNMAFRRKAIGKLIFDIKLKGKGAQVNNDMGFCLQIKKNGWKIIYDPKIIVKHYAAERFDEDKRDTYNPYSLENCAYNETKIILNYLGFFRSIFYILWSLFIGTKAQPGMILALFLINKQGLSKYFSTLRGKYKAVIQK